MFGRYRMHGDDYSLAMQLLNAYAAPFLVYDVLLYNDVISKQKTVIRFPRETKYKARTERAW